MKKRNMRDDERKEMALCIGVLVSILALLVSFYFNTVSRIPRPLLLVSWQTAINGRVKATGSFTGIFERVQMMISEALRPHFVIPFEKFSPLVPDIL